VIAVLLDSRDCGIMAKKKVSVPSLRKKKAHYVFGVKGGQRGEPLDGGVGIIGGKDGLAQQKERRPRKFKEKRRIAVLKEIWTREGRNADLVEEKRRGLSEINIPDIGVTFGGEESTVQFTAGKKFNIDPDGKGKSERKLSRKSSSSLTKGAS